MDIVKEERTRLNEHIEVERVTYKGGSVRVKIYVDGVFIVECLEDNSLDMITKIMNGEIVPNE